MNLTSNTYNDVQSLSQYNDIAIDYLIDCLDNSNVELGVVELSRKKLGDLLTRSENEILDFANELYNVDWESLNAYLELTKDKKISTSESSKLRNNSYLDNGIWWWQKFFWLMHEFNTDKYMLDPVQCMPWSKTDDMPRYNIHPGGTRKWALMASDAISCNAIVYNHNVWPIDLEYKKIIKTRDDVKSLFKTGWLDRGTFYVCFPYDKEKSMHPHLFPNLEHNSPWFEYYIEEWMKKIIDKIWKHGRTSIDKKDCFILHYTEAPLEKFYINVFQDRSVIWLKEQMHSKDFVKIGNLDLIKKFDKFIAYGIR